MRERLTEWLGVRPSQVYEVEGLLDQSELWELVALDRPDLKPAPWVPVVPPRWARATGAADVFEEIRRGDLFVQQPYDSFRASFEALAQAAARDPDVIAIKTAVYRTSDESSLIGSLIECAEDGKQSVCLVELKARFDERRNIEWSRAMEEAGVHVVHGFPDLKIHAKMTLVVRREAGGLRRYAHIGTGNYNASTARVYEDVGLFTADEEITADVADLFNYVTGFGRPQRFRKLLVAPFTMRSRIVEEIRRVTEAAAAGQTARIRLKVNALVDPTIIEELYTASAAGVPIEIVARSICMLRPGVEGLSESIRVTSIVGRFLEHSRIYWFEAGDDVSVYLGSADLMPRNLDRRIEVLAPVENARARAEVSAILDSALADTTNTWELDARGDWRRREVKEKKARSHQEAMMRRAHLRARRSRA
jgi:polyphosphate kinase